MTTVYGFKLVQLVNFVKFDLTRKNNNFYWWIYLLQKLKIYDWIFNTDIYFHMDDFGNCQITYPENEDS